ncbi:MAG: hypothetical protein HYY60_03345 [Parcubacteria group bacterium]|nr:hypothetical protein [Parcubacteria group bacterium]
MNTILLMIKSVNPVRNPHLSLCIRHKSRKAGSLEDNDKPLSSAGFSYGVNPVRSRPRTRKIQQ